MVIRSSVRVALACAGLSPLVAGLMVHAQHGARAAAPAPHTSPWGTLSFVYTRSDEGDRLGDEPDIRRHLRLIPPTAAAQVTDTTVRSDAVAARAPEQVTASVSPDLVRSAGEAAPDRSPAADQPAFQVPSAQAVALTADGTPVTLSASAAQPATAADDARVEDGSDDRVRPGAQVNINTASITALNHIPGMSNVGRAIINHRPYRSIEDLVSRRVLKSSDFQRVKDRVKT